MKHILLASVMAACLAGCATKQQPGPDPRVGTDLSPYRSITPYAECGDCRLPQR